MDAVQRKKEKALRLKMKLREQVKELEKALKERTEDCLLESNLPSKMVREWHNETIEKTNYFN
jgi:hypothetical protein